MRGKWLKTAFIGIVVIILFACIASTNGSARKVTIIESLINDLITFPQKGYTYLREYVTANDNFFVEIDELKKENEELKKRVEELETKVIDYESIAAENQILKSHVNLVDKYPDYTVVIADIISDSATNWEATYIINRGSDDGVVLGMSVIEENGLVGYVESVTANTAKIISILDAGNSISARVTRTRDEVICKGSISLAESQDLKVMNIPTGTILVEGDKLETSGLGGIYPKGIEIGEVIEVINKQNPLENEAVVETYVDFNKLETVAIIINQK